MGEVTLMPAEDKSGEKALRATWPTKHDEQERMAGLNKHRTSPRTPVFVFIVKAKLNIRLFNFATNQMCLVPKSDQILRTALSQHKVKTELTKHKVSTYLWFAKIYIANIY